MAKHRFVCILLLPPPDCAHCKRYTVWNGTPHRFRPEGAIHYSGCRDLCGSCYRHLRVNDPDKLTSYPRHTRKILDVHEEYQFLVSQGATSIEDAARIIGMTPVALDRALYRARHMLTREGVAA